MCLSTITALHSSMQLETLYGPFKLSHRQDPQAIIATELVSTIHTPHEFVVADDRLRTGDWHPRSIFLSADTFPFWIVTDSPLEML